MNQSKPSKSSALFDTVLLALCILVFFWFGLATFGILPCHVNSLALWILPILTGASSFSRLWLAWQGKQAPLSLIAILSLAVEGLAILLWRLSGRPFSRYDPVYLLLVPVVFAMMGIVRFNQEASQSGGDGNAPTS